MLVMSLFLRRMLPNSFSLLIIRKVKDTFNHGVAENFCEWYATESSPGQSDLTLCKSSKAFFNDNCAAFLG